MSGTLEIKWPWEMIWLETADDLIDYIKCHLPPDHELQNHDLFPGVKWDKKMIFIVDDDTTGDTILMDFENQKRWGKSKFKIPAMTVFKDNVEVSEQIEQDHIKECAKYNDDGSLK